MCGLVGVVDLVVVECWFRGIMVWWKVEEIINNDCIEIRKDYVIG